MFGQVTAERLTAFFFPFFFFIYLFIAIIAVVKPMAISATVNPSFLLGFPTKISFISVHSVNATQYIRNVWGAIRFPRLDGTNNQIALQGAP